MATPMQRDESSKLRIGGRSCFIAAPDNASRSTLERILNQYQVHVERPADLPSHQSRLPRIRDAARRADFVVGILSGAPSDASVLFELGCAYTLRKRILLFVPPGQELPALLTEFALVRATVDNEEAVIFAIEQLLRAPAPARQLSLPLEQSLPPLGPVAQRFRERARKIATERELEELVRDLLRACGVEALSQPRYENLRPDFAVWSSSLASQLGNPIIVEVKRFVRPQAQYLRNAVHQVHEYVRAANAQWGLLIVLGPIDMSAVADIDRPGVIIVDLLGLIEQLKSASLSDVILSLKDRDDTPRLF